MVGSPLLSPFRRLFEEDWEGLSEVELLALALAPGQPEGRALELAHKLLALGEDRLVGAGLEELRRCGLSRKRALALQAAFQLVPRLQARRLSPGEAFRSSRQVAQHFQARLGPCKRECFWSVLLDGKNRILRLVPISQGSLTSSLVHPREVFRPAVREAAAGVLFVHNHPSGDPQPSQEDLQITRRLVQTGKLLGIRVLDHVIIGAGRYFSFADQGLL